MKEEIEKTLQDIKGWAVKGLRQRHLFSEPVTADFRLRGMNELDQVGAEGFRNTRGVT